MQIPLKTLRLFSGESPQSQSGVGGEERRRKREGEKEMGWRDGERETN